jgi:small subunit ribosomal protein S16
MLTIRLQRVGKAKKPTYRLIVSEKARDTQGTYLELLGSFNPQVKENQLVTKTDRIQYWISKGATMSPTVNNLFVKAGIVKGKAVKSVFLSQKRAAKIAEKKKAAEPAPAAATAAAPTVGPDQSGGGQAEGQAPAEAPALESVPAETPAA